jgi:hypothetical protein
MYRTTNLLAGLVLALASFAVAQDEPATLQTPEDAMQPRQLIAWSSLQKPQPAPQPLPPPDTPIPQPGDDQQAKPPADSHTGQSPAADSGDHSPAAQSFTGKIVKDSGKYVLKVASNTSYELEGEGDLNQYENQTVKVVGNLDKATNTIHVVKIELLS